MAWTTPRTWNVGDVLTADMNTYARDNVAFLSATQSQTINATDVNFPSASSFQDPGWRGRSDGFAQYRR
jgi:hypothetical protein